jgi:hypothetical protein
MPDAARINTLSTTSKKREKLLPFPLKGREFAIIRLKEFVIANAVKQSSGLICQGARCMRKWSFALE